MDSPEKAPGTTTTSTSNQINMPEGNNSSSKASFYPVIHTGNGPDKNPILGYNELIISTLEDIPACGFRCHELKIKIPCNFEKPVYANQCFIHPNLISKCDAHQSAEVCASSTDACIIIMYHNTPISTKKEFNIGSVTFEQGLSCDSLNALPPELMPPSTDLAGVELPQDADVPI